MVKPGGAYREKENTAQQCHTESHHLSPGRHRRTARQTPRSPALTRTPAARLGVRAATAEPSPAPTSSTVKSARSTRWCAAARRTAGRPCRQRRSRPAPRRASDPGATSVNLTTTHLHTQTGTEHRDRGTERRGERTQETGTSEPAKRAQWRA